jgi:hypothetical protein
MSCGYRQIDLTVAMTISAIEETVLAGRNLLILGCSYWVDCNHWEQIECFCMYLRLLLRSEDENLDKQSAPVTSP